MKYDNKLFKVVLDMLMLVLIIIQMSSRLISPQVHMLLGLTLFILFIIHNLVELKWYKNLFKGHLTPIRIASIVINIALLLNMIIMMISAAFLPQFINEYVPYSIKYAAKYIHIIAGSWLFVIISIHLSLHPATASSHSKKLPVGQAKNSRDYVKDFIKYAVLLLIFIYGIKAFIDRDMFLRMFSICSKNEFKTNSSIIKPLADYTSIMIVISYVSYKILKLVKRKTFR